MRTYDELKTVNRVQKRLPLLQAPLQALQQIPEWN